MYSTSPTLLQRVRRRDDQAAWDRFVRLYTPFLYHCARKPGLNETEAADVVQDVFVLLLDKLPVFEYAAGGSFRAWLRTVTENKIRERFRKRREVAAGGSDPGLDAFPSPNGLSDFIDAEHDRFVAAEMLKLIQSDFEPTTWQAFWLTTVEDRPAADVAAELGITLNAIYVARSRVLRHLREELRDLIDE